VITGLLVQAAVRRTPVLLDGLAPCSCALLAAQLAPDAVRWWLAATRSPEPAQRLALQGLQLTPLLDLQLRLGEGSGALLALPLLGAAAATLAEMATAQEAGLSR
jgi:nicotinate-nucleotide--dimethylbenzimidazole phosphoribosyltransferase